MRSNILLTALAIGSTVTGFTVAHAQTLDNQMQRMQQGQPAMPQQPSQMAMPPADGAPQEWPANRAMATRPGTSTVAANSTGSGAIPALPLDVMNSGGVTFINGGVGDEEVAELKARENEFNIHVLLSAPHGEFVSDIKLQVMDNKGTPLVSLDDAGPYFYAKMLPGTYYLEASHPGDATKKIKFVVTGKNVVKQQITFGEDGGIVSPHEPTAKID